MQIETTMRNDLTQVRMTMTKGQETTSVGEDAEKQSPCALPVGMQAGAATVETSMEGPHKIKTGAAAPSGNFASG